VSQNISKLATLFLKICWCTKRLWR